MTYHSAGTLSCKCVSFARSGLPDAVCAPLTTKLLLPVIWEDSSSNCVRISRAEFDSCATNGGISDGGAFDDSFVSFRARDKKSTGAVGGDFEDASERRRIKSPTMKWSRGEKLENIWRARSGPTSCTIHSRLSFCFHVDVSVLYIYRLMR